MALFELTQNDINDLLALISSSTLAIQANQAARVFALQKTLRELAPSAELERARKAVNELEAQVSAALKARDNALLEAGLVKKRVDELELAGFGDAQIGQMIAGAKPS